MRKLNKVLALCLALVMAFSLMSLSALADEETLYTVTVETRVFSDWSIYSNCPIEVQDSDGNTVATGVTGSDGIVTFSLPEGTYTFICTPPDTYQSSSESRPVNDSMNNDVTFDLWPILTKHITVSAYDESIYQYYPNATITVKNSDGEEIFSGKTSSDTYSSADLGDLAYGTYTATLTVPDGYLCDEPTIEFTVNSETGDQTNYLIKIRPDESRTDVFGTLTVKVLDENGNPADVVVTLLKGDPDKISSLCTREETDSNGKWSKTLEPGTYGIEINSDKDTYQEVTVTLGKDNYYVIKLGDQTEEPVEDEDPCDPYTDVQKDAWYHDAVDYAIENKIMTGTSATTFEPGSSVTRAMVVQVLYAQAGKPAVSGSSPFTDLTSNWYKDAVTWAYQNKVAAGISDTKFAPDQKVTREQLATFLKAYASFCKLDTSATASLSGYTDASSISNYARDNVAWAVASGLISGRTTATIVPKGTATRAEFAQMMMKFGALK